MELRKAFWQASMTVGLPFLIWGCVLYMLGFRADEWLVYATFVILPGLVLFAIIYFRSWLGGPEPRNLTRRQSLVRGIVTASFAIGLSALALLDSEAGWRTVPYWVMAAGWLLIAADHFSHAYKASDSVPAKS